MSLPDPLVSEPQKSAGETPAAARAPRAFHPLLFAAFPVLSLLAHNRHEARLAWAAAPLAAAVVLALVPWGLFGWIMASRAKGALVASLLVLLFFSFGHTVVPLADREAADWPVVVLQVLLGEAAAVAVVCLLLHRMRRGIGGLTRFANVVSAVLVLLPLMSLAWFEVTRPRGAATAPAAGSATAQRPDIYLIIPDAHARADVMREVYGYDMDPFLWELESLGFVVADESASNYALTPLSVASMLNFRYLDEMEGRAWGDLGVPAELIRESALESTLKSSGYGTVAFPTGAPYTEMRQYDQYYHGLGAAAG